MPFNILGLSYSCQPMPLSWEKADLSTNFTYWGAIAAKPLWSTTSALLRLFTSFPPKCRNNIQVKVEISFQRSISASFAILFLPLTLISKIISLVFRKIGLLTQQENLIHLKGEFKELRVSSTQAFSIFNLNACIAPGLFCKLFGGMPDSCMRIEKLAKKILKSAAAFVCLEEILCHFAAFKLYSLLKKAYRNFCLLPGDEILGLNSGLFFATKFPLEKAKFYSFKQKIVNYSSSSLNRGLLSVRVRLSVQRKVHIFQTHLTSSKIDCRPTQRERRLRSMELTFIRKKIEKMKNNYPSDPIILLGDLNIVKNSDEFKDSILFSQFKGHENDIERTCTAFFEKYVWDPNAKAEKPYVLDYILLNKDNNYTIQTSPIETFNLKKKYTSPISDHMGLHSIINRA